MHPVYANLKINNKFSTHEYWNMNVITALSKGNS